MAFVTSQTASMLEDSGEFQRAYVVQRIADELYDHFAAKHKDRYETAEELHRAAQTHSMTMLLHIIQQGR